MTKVINLRKYTKTRLNKRKKDDVKTSIREEKYKVLLLVISIFSILMGCIIFKYNKEYGNIIFNGFFTTLKSGNFVQVLLNLIRLDLCFFILVFLIGTSFIGKILVFIPPMLKSIIIGYISSFMYYEYKTNGIMFCLIVLYPYLAITTSSLIFAVNESAFMSNYVRSVITHKNTADDTSIKLYFMRYLILIGINIICAFINTLFIIYFVPKFNLV
ncbi:MAG: hypothetical protein J6B37_08825 [Clostridia bacterium]|nr:hypothetical protein [Clostridia bacterium]